jgi:gliding motility-associated-like protein
MLVCKDTLVDLTAPRYPGATYRWSTGSTDTVERFTRGGTYWLEITTPGCSLSDTITLLFNSLVQAPEVEPVVLCLGSRPGQLEARGQNLRWYDTLPVGGTPSGSAPVPRTSVMGEQTYYVSQTIYGCESPRAPLLVEVIQAPQFSLGENILIPCGSFGVSLQVVEQKYTQYRWSDGREGPQYDATRGGLYVLQGDNMCGSLVDTVVAVDCDTRCVRFPNTFTPNGDGLNDAFSGIAHCPVDRYHMVVFNRFGEKVFEGFNPADRWDGTYKGKAQPSGAYVYNCVYFDFVLKQELSVKGTTYIMR